MNEWKSASFDSTMLNFSPFHHILAQLLRSTVNTQDISIVSLFVTKEGVERIHEKFPSVSIYSAHCEESIDDVTPFSELYFGWMITTKREEAFLYFGDFKIWQADQNQVNLS